MYSTKITSSSVVISPTKPSHSSQGYSSDINSQEDDYDDTASTTEEATGGSATDSEENTETDDEEPRYSNSHISAGGRRYVASPSISYVPTGGRSNKEHKKEKEEPKGDPPELIMSRRIVSVRRAGK